MSDYDNDGDYEGVVDDVDNELSNHDFTINPGPNIATRGGAYTSSHTVDGVVIMPQRVRGVQSWIYDHGSITKISNRSYWICSLCMRVYLIL